MWRTDSWQNEWFDHQTVWNNWTWIKILSYILTVAHYSSHEIPCTQQPDQALASKNVLNHLLPNGWLDWMEDNLHIAAQMQWHRIAQPWLGVGLELKLCLRGQQLHSRHLQDDLWLCRYRVPQNSMVDKTVSKIPVSWWPFGMIWPFSVPSVEKSHMLSLQTRCIHCWQLGTEFIASSWV